MSKIIVLPSEISLKIAAGEVIERPFSVVKELIENSLDAEATDIKVELLDGGKRRIHVMDNGYGMSREDALVCFKRHSTSKILKEVDLDRITTLGFRGEALPSISAVSKVTLKTAVQKETKGTQIRREAEEQLDVSDTAFPLGTSIEVNDLFFNLPARKKFLRSDRSELGHITRFLINIALSFFDVRFSLFHENRRIFNYPAVKSLKERIFQIYGRSVLDRLLEVDCRDGERRLNGYVSCPPTGRRDRKHQFFFINRRPVKDKVLAAALNQAFKAFMEKDHSAEAFLFFEVPFTDVDVNVHPAKTEVRFVDSSPVFRLVNMGVEQTVLKEMGVKQIYPSQLEERKNFNVKEPALPPIFQYPGEKIAYSPNLFGSQGKKDNGYPRVLGQFLDMYIIAWDEKGILIIDQHNAHERVLYEKYKKIDEQKEWPRKLVLFPVLLELSPSQILYFESCQDTFEEMGFRVESMGGQSYALKEYPDIYKEEEARDKFLSLVEEIKDKKLKNKKEKLLATMACQTAVKARESLSSEKMEYLVEELFKTNNPLVCPHGRPITLRIERGEIERGLGRA